MNTELKQNLSEFIKQRLPPMPLMCVVSDVDLISLTCYCQPIDGSAGVTDVRLMASVSKGFLVIPQDQSIVGVSFINDNSAYISMTSGVQEIQLNGDNFGGLTKTLELQTQLNKLNAQLQAILTAATTWAPVANDGGAAFKTAAISALSGKPIAVFTNIENQTVKAGDGT